MERAAPLPARWPPVRRAGAGQKRVTHGCASVRFYSAVHAVGTGIALRLRRWKLRELSLHELTDEQLRVGMHLVLAVFALGDETCSLMKSILKRCARGE